MSCTIRLASWDDVPAILEIYAPYVRETVISFEYDVPELPEFRGRFTKFTKQCPWFVCEVNGRITGYSYAHPFHERAAYKWTAECSIYVDAASHGKNIGKALYACLLDTMKLQGYTTAFGSVTVPNAKSEALHASFGFEKVGVLKKIGFKNGSWHDVAYYELQLSDYPTAPRSPKPIWEVVDTPEFFDAVKKAAALVKR